MLQVDGPFHFWQNRPRSADGPTLLKRAILRSSMMGPHQRWQAVISVSHTEWAQATARGRAAGGADESSAEQQQQARLLEAKLREAGLDPTLYFSTPAAPPPPSQGGQEQQPHGK